MIEVPIPIVLAIAALGFVLGVVFGEVIDNDCDFGEHQNPTATTPAVIDLPFNNNGAVREFAVTDGTRCIAVEGPSGYALSCDWSTQTCE